MGVIYATLDQDPGSDIQVTNNRIFDSGRGFAVYLSPKTAGNRITGNTIRNGKIVDQGQGNITTPNTSTP